MTQPNQLISKIVREVRSDRCDIHGDFTATRIASGSVDFWTKCPDCAEISRKKRENDRVNEEMRDQVRGRIAAAEIPRHFVDAGLDDGVPEAVHKWLSRLLAGNSAGPLILVGNVGTGKTFAAIAGLRHVIENGVQGCYLTTTAYGRAIRATWGKQNGDTNETAVLNRYAHAGFLVLDELGASRDVDAPLVQDLICERYEAARMPPTIIVSNLAPAKFAETIGERAADRIREGSSVVTMTGKSRRKPAGSAS